VEKVRRLASGVDKVLVLEEGYPWLERFLRGILPVPIEIAGKLSGHLPQDGELSPDLVRRALGIAARPGTELRGLELVGRPPQLCKGCPHSSAYEALNRALQSFEQPLVASDIGCYTLGALPPYSAIESCVCMGASIGMARGAAAAGLHPAVAVIGDSTFLHSGVTPLMDAVAADADVTVLILDNGTVAMTGLQPTILPSSRLEPLVLGLGVDPAHFHVVEARPQNVERLAEILRRELDHRGLSVVIAGRECLEAARKRKQEERKRSRAGGERA
jgi:indolepyruvate ferredoxin oxidoreductase alpha subunit